MHNAHADPERHREPNYYLTIRHQVPWCCTTQMCRTKQYIVHHKRFWSHQVKSLRNWVLNIQLYLAIITVSYQI